MTTRSVGIFLIGAGLGELMLQVSAIGGCLVILGVALMIWRVES